MIRSNTRSIARLAVVAAMVTFAAHGHAAAGAVTPAFAACSKALIETLTGTDLKPSFTVKAPSSFVSDLVDPNAFTVIARKAKSRELVAKAACKATSRGEIVSFRSLPVKS